MARKYSSDRCNKLRNDAKNLRNMKYRRRVNRDKYEKGSPDYNKFQKEIENLNEKIDRKRSSIWRCTEEYFNLKQAQKSDYSKIRYRESKLAELDKNTPEYKRYKSEISELKLSQNQIKEKLFTGSDKYQNMGVNYERLVRRIKYLQSQFLDRKKRAESGELDKFGKPISFEESDRMRAITEIKELGEKAEALREVIENRKIEYIEHERVEFAEDEETMTDYADETIFSYREAFERALSGDYNTVEISGELISDQSFSYPQEEIQLMYAISVADVKYSPHASKVYVRITRNNLDNTVNLRFELWEEIDENEKE